ncbi:MAG: ATP-grasp domain-containing protein [Burkholderiales bacterium]
MPLTLLVEPWRAHPLAWIHRGEAWAITRELRATGRVVHMLPFREDAIGTLPPGPLLLRVSDPVMLAAVRALARAAIPYIGPGAPVMERCYDKYEACRSVFAHGVDTPATVLAPQADALPYPMVLKPRRGSDSIGLRVLRSGPVPAHARTERYIAQEFVRGSELTVGVLRGDVGAPFRILLPEGTPYRFWRKYLWQPVRAPVEDRDLAARVREAAQRIATLLGVDWAARIDFIHETATGRLRFLECDVAPLVGPGSAFAASFAASGVERPEQLRRLIAAKD